ncbi:hypothetical protein BH24ACT5_BH24ACT5_26850 [soil metagenome]
MNHLPSRWAVRIAASAAAVFSLAAIGGSAAASTDTTEPAA